MGTRNGLSSLLLQPRIDIVEGPSTVSQVSAKRVAEVVVSHNVSHGMHKSLKATIRQRSNAGYVVSPDLALGGISFLSVGTVQDDVEINEIQVAKRFVGTRRAEGIQRGVEPLQLCLEEHNTTGREVFGHDNFAIRTFIIETLWDNHGSRFNKLPSYTAQRLVIVAAVVRRKVNMGTVDELGFSASKLDRRD